VAERLDKSTMFHGETLKAWQVMKDCEQAIICLEGATEEDPWKLYYLASVTLLRAVGHVIVNTDAVEIPILGPKIKAVWSDIEINKKTYEIFWGFIKPERDRILKEYRFSTIGFDIADPAILRFEENGEIKDWGTEEKTLYLNIEAERCSEMSLPNDAAGLLREGLGFWADILYGLEFHSYPFVYRY
jgi:hypothetical protein